MIAYSYFVRFGKIPWYFLWFLCIEHGLFRACRGSDRTWDGLVGRWGWLGCWRWCHRHIYLIGFFEGRYFLGVQVQVSCYVWDYFYSLRGWWVSISWWTDRVRLWWSILWIRWGRGRLYDLYHVFQWCFEVCPFLSSEILSSSMSPSWVVQVGSWCVFRLSICWTSSKRFYRIYQLEISCHRWAVRILERLWLLFFVISRLLNWRRTGRWGFCRGLSRRWGWHILPRLVWSGGGRRSALTFSLASTKSHYHWFQWSVVLSYEHRSWESDSQV
jgi:hypothetical protein